MSEVTGGAASSVGDGDKRWFVGFKLSDDLVKSVEAFLGTWRKEFK